MSIDSVPPNIPLSPSEKRGRDHAHVAFFAFFVGLPLGVLAARWLRTFTKSWIIAHMIVNGFLVCPLVVTAYVLGLQTSDGFSQYTQSDSHQNVGQVLFILYWVQLALGLFIHYVKFPRIFSALGGHRPQNFLHIAIGLSILVLASWQTHNGLYVEWARVTGNAHPVRSGCRRFWLAILVIFWSLFALGLAFLPLQIRQERAARAGNVDGIKNAEDTPPLRE